MIRKPTYVKTLVNMIGEIRNRTSVQPQWLVPGYVWRVPEQQEQHACKVQAIRMHGPAPTA